LGHWIKRLLPYAKGSALWRALEAACDERGFPSLGWVMDAIQQEQRRDTKPFEAPPLPTAAEKIRSDAAAIKSMLWLHYVHGFDVEHIGGIIGGSIARLFAAQTGQTPAEAMEAAKLLPGHDRESILAWMIEQESKGN